MFVYVCVYVCVCVCVCVRVHALACIVMWVWCVKTDPQTKAWVGHCTCVVETGLATQHWSGKSENCA